MTSIVAIDYEISSTCQARCPVCVRQSGGKLKDFVQTQRTLDETKHILDGVASGLEFVKLCGNWGDPMGCDVVADICEWLISESPKVRIDISTNGAIGKPKTYQRLGKMGVNIVFGLDGSDQESNELYRRNVKWSDAMDNLKAYSSECTAKDSSWQYLLFNENKNHLESAIKIAIENKIKFFTIIERPVPFAAGMHESIDKVSGNQWGKHEIIKREGQQLPVYFSGRRETGDHNDVEYILTPAFDMTEKVKELKEKYASDLHFI